MWCVINHYWGEELMRAGKLLVAAALLAVGGGAAFAVARPESVPLKRVADESVAAVTTADKKPASDNVRFHLVTSSDAVKKCMPHAKVNITVKLRTDATGRDVFLSTRRACRRTRRSPRSCSSSPVRRSVPPSTSVT